MKDFKDYCNEFDSYLNHCKDYYPANKFFCRRCVWILCKWEFDNDIDPWSDIYLYTFLCVRKYDIDLFNELCDGYLLIYEFLYSRDDSDSDSN